MPNRCILAVGWAGLVLAGAAMAPDASAQAADFGEDALAIRSWETDNGLPRNQVISVILSRDGYLWMGTLNGLVRFDGRQFSVYDRTRVPELPSNQVVHLFEDREGNLWVGTEADGVALVRASGVEVLPIGGSDSGGKLVSTCQDRQGAVWLLTAGGELARYLDGKVDVWRMGDSRPGLYHGVIVEQSGTVLVGMNREIHELDAAAVRSREPLPERRVESFGKLDWILASRQGGHWRLADGRIRLIRDGEVVRDLGTYPWFGTGFPVSAACEDTAGNLVVGVFGAGVYRFDAGGTMRHSGVAEGLSSDYVLSLATDLEDSLWVGTDGGGLNRIRREPFATIQTTLGQVVQAITRDQDGALWVGYNGGGLECLYEGFDLLLMTVDDLAAVPDSGNRLAVIVRNRADDTLHFRVFDLMGQAVVDNPESDFPDKPGEIAGLKSLLSPLWGQETPTPDQQKAVIDAVDSVVGLPHLGQFRQGLLQAPVRALLCDRANRVWVGLWGGGVIQWRDGRMDPIPSVGLTVVFALHEDRDGKIWVGGDGGLARWDGGEWRRFTTRDGLSSNRVRALADDAAGSLWVGTSDAGLNRFDGREFTAYRRSPDGLPGDRVVTLHVARDDALWVGTEGDGLARFSGDRWIRAGIAEGLPSNDVGFFLEDAQTNLWIGTTAGLLRVGRDTLRAWVAGETSRIEGRVYERADGLPTCECTLGPGMDLPHLNAGEDRLWLPTIKGLATAVASAVVPNRFAPPVRIESVAIEGRTEDGAGLRAPPIRRVTLPPDRRRLEVHYTSLNLGAPDRARFRYRLRDHDDSWTDAGDVRVAHFTKLSPGEYTFEVEAANEDGVWSAEPAMLTVIVEPPFWRTWWFLLVSGGAVLGAVIATVHLISTQRLKRQVAVLRQQEALERERARIARDLHDQLGASLTQVALLGELAESDKDLPEEVESHARQISQTARETTRVLDEIVWAVNPRNDTLDGLITYLCKNAQEYLSVAGLRYRQEVPDDLPDTILPPEVRHNVFLAAKEAVTNVVRHAQATEARVRVRLEHGRLILQIEDNGRGPIEAETAQARGRHGLDNMRKRMEEVGGRYALEAGRDGGTRVLLEVPVRIPDS